MTKATPSSKVFDTYPSRIFEQPRLTDRFDPVVYLKSKPSRLSSDELHFFERNGYLMIKKLFSVPEVQELRDQVEDLLQDPTIHDRPEVIREPSSEVRSIFAPHRFRKSFGALAKHKPLLTRVQEILASPMYIHQYRINIKRPFEGKEFYWHSDFETWHVEDGMPRMRSVSCMIFLEDNNEFNGPLMVIPGSHQSFISCIGQTPEDHYKLSLVKQEYGIPDKKTLAHLIRDHGLKSVQGPAGSVLLFDCNLMHGSSGNISPFGRSNLFMVYNSCDNKLRDPFSGLPPRPDYVANRDFTPLAL